MNARPMLRTSPDALPQEPKELLPFTPLFHLEHLLKVAQSVALDADSVWAEIWAQFRPYVTSDGLIGPELKAGFVPACGWPEFLEKLWVLKHYLDSVQRICRKEH